MNKISIEWKGYVHAKKSCTLSEMNIFGLKSSVKPGNKSTLVKNKIAELKARRIKESLLV